MCVGPVHQLALSVELFVLDNQGKVGHTQLQIKRLGELALVVIIDQEETRQAVIGLLGGQIVRVGVVPVGAPAVAHREVVLVACSWPDGVAGMSVHLGGSVQPVPVNDGRLSQRVVQAGCESRASLDAQYRVLVGLPPVLGLVQQEGRRGLRRRAGQQGETGRRGAELQRRRDIQHAERPAGNRNEELLLKVLGGHRIEWIVAKRPAAQCLGGAMSEVQQPSPGDAGNDHPTGQQLPPTQHADPPKP